MSSTTEGRDTWNSLDERLFVILSSYQPYFTFEDASPVSVKSATGHILHYPTVEAVELIARSCLMMSASAVLVQVGFLAWRIYQRVRELGMQLSVLPDELQHEIVEAVKRYRNSSLQATPLPQVDLNSLFRLFVTIGCPTRIARRLADLVAREVVKAIHSAMPGSGAGGQKDSADTKQFEPCEADKLLQEKIQKDDFDVFLAYESGERQPVLQIGQRLRGQGLYPWIDVEQIAPGRWFQDVIQATMPHVRAAALVLGKKGLGPWQALEVRSFISQCVDRHLPVIPVLLPEAIEIPDAVPFLRELHCVRFRRSVLEDDSALIDLIWGITGRKPSALIRPTGDKDTDPGE